MTGQGEAYVAPARKIIKKEVQKLLPDADPKLIQGLDWWQLYSIHQDVVKSGKNAESMAIKYIKGYNPAKIRAEREKAEAEKRRIEEEKVRRAEEKRKMAEEKVRAAAERVRAKAEAAKATAKAKAEQAAAKVRAAAERAKAKADADAKKAGTNK
ncbi:MAG: hypothetical protein P9M00_02555 [Candidatus Tritonobacter lacicola]|nr:hypothetical protein [Candidatus Tritonobacter lacicola]